MNLTWLGAPACGSDGTAWRAEWQRLECEVIELVNQRRAAGATCGTRRMGPAPPLTRQQQLTKSARLHAEDMAERNYFDHFTPEGRSPAERMQAAGFRGTTMAENISAGQPTAEKVVDDWMKSEHHCDNIMNPALTQIGVGYYKTESGRYKHYWVQNFGSGVPVVEAPPPPRRVPGLRAPSRRTAVPERVENQPPHPPEELPRVSPPPPGAALQPRSNSLGLFVLGGAIAAVAALVFFT